MASLLSINSILKSLDFVLQHAAPQKSSGKSTLAKALGEIYHIPVLYLDKETFSGDWVLRSDEEINKRVQKFMNTNESWIIDGNYTRICPERFINSDMTLFLNLNRFICLFSAVCRYFKHRFIPRESSNCPDKLSGEFLWWLVYKGRTSTRKRAHLTNLNKTQGQKIILNSRSEVNNFLNNIKIQQKNS
ncbi:hypothetical protein PIROE2DRAFT_63151 [Piromyces sp. E2]|nr:hypothetical protein PIROE2DRAFT_63151 [Piromyces sp. E2]|eukprot:OUM60426.1 hypothetical protein PIROE2DRAFT_63151 [Piromyces sp. E2]